MNTTHNHNQGGHVYAIATIPVQRTQPVGTSHAPDVRDAPCVYRWRVVGTLVLALILLAGCGDARGVAQIEETTTITRVQDFSAMVPFLTFWCCIGIAACVACLLWVPIQKWIPLTGLTFFGGCIGTAWTVSWLLEWLPWIIGAGLIIGLLWLAPYLRGLILAIRRSWNEPQDAPNPPIIEKILRGKA